MDNPNESNYLVGLSGIAVADQLVDILGDVWRVKDIGGGGVILDTGTYLTWLPAAAYYPFRNKFRAWAGSLGLRRAREHDSFILVSLYLHH